MKETYLYICEYCQKEYKPSRRRVQKFCSDTCRSKNWYFLNNNPAPIAIESNESTNSEVPLEEQQNKNKNSNSKGVTLTGIGESAAGALLASEVKNLFTKHHNKTATKGDLIKLVDLIEKNHRTILDELNGMNNSEVDITL